MKSRFILFKRSGVYYAEDTTTGKQSSLRTKDEAEALTEGVSKLVFLKHGIIGKNANFYISRAGADLCSI